MRVTEAAWKAMCPCEMYERCESEDHVSHLKSPDRRNAANATQNADLTLTPPSSSLLISWMSDMRGI